MLYPPDIKLLTRLKTAQCSPTHYVVIDYDHLMAFPATGFYHIDVETAIGSGNGISLNISHAELEVSLAYLLKEGCIEKPSSGPVYHVTHSGWYNRYARRRECLRMFLTHILFPMLVAAVTTIFTLWLSDKIENRYSNKRPSYSTEDTYQNPE